MIVNINTLINIFDRYNSIYNSKLFIYTLVTHRVIIFYLFSRFKYMKLIYKNVVNIINSCF
jgi:hypothetical protein